MSASQRVTRRRSAQQSFQGDETRPAKKQKTAPETTKPTKQSNGRRSGPPRKAKADYDEDADGFQFTRAKARKPTSKDTASASTADPPTSASQPSTEAAPPRPGRRKKVPAEIASQLTEDGAEESGRRRSLRLSGGTLPPQEDSQQPQEESIDAQMKAPATKSRTKRAKTPAQSEIEVERKRGPSKIPLPFADTPVITRNKEMRKNSAEGHRRSSTGMRGRRASSLIESGTSNAMPHSEVAKEEFYKHISQDLLEPRRMQQLLSWCGTRVLPEKPSGSSEDVNTILAARVVQEELLRDFSKKSELLDWFNREDVAPTVLVKKPNPRNIQNAAKLQELEREVKRLTEEKKSWDTVLSSLKTAPANHGQYLERLAMSGVEGAQSSLLDQPEQASILERAQSHHQHFNQVPTRLKEATANLEFKLDTVADGVHKLQKLKESADCVLDVIMSNAASALEERDRAALERSGMERVGVGDILRSLSRA